MIFQFVEPIAESYVLHINRFCNCEPPEWCSCQIKTRTPSIQAPYTFAKLHGCLPGHCKCPQAKDVLMAPPADLYLNPLFDFVGRYLGYRINKEGGRSFAFLNTRRSQLSVSFFY